MARQFTPKQVAQAIGVSESSLKRWCDKGLLETEKTAGGHRRLTIDAVVKFVRSTGQQLLRPELIGLVAGGGRKATLDKQAAAVLASLTAGDDLALRRVVLESYLGGVSLAEVCDRWLAPAFAKIGHGWENGTLAVYQERRAVEICQRLLFELAALLPRPQRDAPSAMGGTLAGDPYQLATAMVELVLRDAGWQAQSYGAGLPAETLVAAIETTRPRLVWLSVSAFESRQNLTAAVALIAAAATRCGTALVIGGRALGEDVRRDLTFSAYGDNLHHLLGFARTLCPTTDRPNASEVAARL
ncbi:MAG: cobalamin-dependent protein [Pirellulales bacterium]|nr:cobalamin-dependent protein [Pirellulales bacterium]